MKNLKNFRMSRRAVSPIIATLLLIAIAVAAAVVTYTFTMNMVSNQGSQAQTAVRIDDVQLGQAVSAGGIRSTTMIPSSTTTQLYVALTTGFGVNNVITVVGTTGTATIATIMPVSGTTPAYFTLSGTGLSGALVGNPTVATSASTTMIPSSTTTQLYVADRTGFVAGDSITVAGFGTAKITTITAAISPTPAYFTLGTALTGTPTGTPAVTVLINAVKMSIRNTGTVPVVIQTIYLSQGSTQLFVKDGIGYPLGAGTVNSLGLINSDSSNFGALTVKSAGITLTDPTRYVYVGTAWSTDLSVSKAYTIKIVTDNGFSMEGIYYAPSSFGP